MAHSSGHPGHGILNGNSREGWERMRLPEHQSHVNYADQPDTTRERTERSYISRTTRDRDYYDNGDDWGRQKFIDRNSEYVRPGFKRPGDVGDGNPLVVPQRRRGPTPRLDPFDSLDTFQAWTLACEYDLRPEIVSQFNPRPQVPDGQTKIKVAVTQQSLSQKTIKDDVRELDRDMALPQKLLRLTAEELQQVESLLEQKNAFEADSQYEWVVAQLNWFSSSSIFESGEPKRRDSTMLYLKRTPKPHVNRAELQRQKNQTAEAENARVTPLYVIPKPPRPPIVLESDSEDESEPEKVNSDYLEAWVLADDTRRKAPLTPNALSSAYPQFISQHDLSEAVRDTARNGASIGKRMLRFRTPILARVSDLISWKRQSETDSNFEWLLAEIEGDGNSSESDESNDSNSESDYSKKQSRRKQSRQKQSATVYLRRALKSEPGTETRVEDVQESKSPATTQDAQNANAKQPSNLPRQGSSNDAPEVPIDKQDQPPISLKNNEGRQTPSMELNPQRPSNLFTASPVTSTHSTTASPIATPSSPRSRSNSDNISHYQPSAAVIQYSTPEPPTVHVAVACQKSTVHDCGREVMPSTNGGILRCADFAQNDPEQPLWGDSDINLLVTEHSAHTNDTERPKARTRSTTSTGRAIITRLFGSLSRLLKRSQRGRRGGNSDDERGSSPDSLSDLKPSSAPKTNRWTKAYLLILTLLLSFAFFIRGVSFDRTMAASYL